MLTDGRTDGQGTDGRTADGHAWTVALFTESSRTRIEDQSPSPMHSSVNEMLNFKRTTIYI